VAVVGVVVMRTAAVGVAVIRALGVAAGLASAGVVVIAVPAACVAAVGVPAGGAGVVGVAVIRMAGGVAVVPVAAVPVVVTRVPAGRVGAGAAGAFSVAGAGLASEVAAVRVAAVRVAAVRVAAVRVAVVPGASAAVSAALIWVAAVPVGGVRVGGVRVALSTGAVVAVGTFGGEWCRACCRSAGLGSHGPPGGGLGSSRHPPEGAPGARHLPGGVPGICGSPGGRPEARLPSSRSRPGLAGGKAPVGVGAWADRSGFMRWATSEPRPSRRRYQRRRDVFQRWPKFRPPVLSDHSGLQQRKGALRGREAAAGGRRRGELVHAPGGSLGPAGRRRTGTNTPRGTENPWGAQTHPRPDPRPGTPQTIAFPWMSKECHPVGRNRDHSRHGGTNLGA
jgi:hypothetical protein